VTAPRGRRWAPVLLAAAATLCIATLGTLATELGSWYRALEKPAWQPPDWLFGPAWTLIFALTALAIIHAWRDSGRGPRRAWTMVLFGVNGALNVTWSLLFFRLQRPDWALFEVFFLWLSIAVLIALLASRSRTASWLLVPYLLWVTFAAALNYAVVDLNAPFGGV